MLAEDIEQSHHRVQGVLMIPQGQGRVRTISGHEPDGSPRLDEPGKANIGPILSLPVMERTIVLDQPVSDYLRRAAKYLPGKQGTDPQPSSDEGRGARQRLRVPLPRRTRVQRRRRNRAASCPRLSCVWSVKSGKLHPAYRVATSYGQQEKGGAAMFPAL